jgi:hypothetical protein
MIMALWNIWLSVLAYRRLGLHTAIPAAVQALARRGLQPR